MDKGINARISVHSGQSGVSRRDQPPAPEPQRIGEKEGNIPTTQRERRRDSAASPSQGRRRDLAASPRKGTSASLEESEGGRRRWPLFAATPEEEPIAAGRERDHPPRGRGTIAVAVEGEIGERRRIFPFDAHLSIAIADIPIGLIGIYCILRA
ncbi:hypothetical protein L596_013083 [Steinernema carpocapsae]|uniref:Uncharacterized protein n=1 Tax=Steinernema carpocapsae TaxID=34508 RepID=A0A4U5NZS4_STECR|nr:hypothetical protein L596_013083 [Steinernema carpocapsae]